jgi:hypothetical protein
MQPEVISYKDAILIQHQNGVDIIDPATQRWSTARNLQSAKWNLSVWKRLCSAFSY